MADGWDSFFRLLDAGEVGAFVPTLMQRPHFRSICFRKHLYLNSSCLLTIHGDVNYTRRQDASCEDMENKKKVAGTEPLATQYQSSIGYKEAP